MGDSHPDDDHRKLLDIERPKAMTAVKYTFNEYTLTKLRETPSPETLTLLDTPQAAADYWRAAVAPAPGHNPDVENFVVVLLNTRRRVIGHVVVAVGTVDSLLCHPREIFRPALVGNAAAIVVLHNHPSGDSSPSEADIKVTRDLIRAGQILRIELLDHVVVGVGQHTSLRELGYFYT